MDNTIIYGRKVSNEWCNLALAQASNYLCGKPRQMLVQPASEVKPDSEGGDNYGDAVTVYQKNVKSPSLFA